MINLGNIEIADLRLGASQVKALYLGSEQIWGGEEPVAGPWLCFTAEEASSIIRLDKNGSPDAVSLETSTDGTSWTDYTWSGTTGSTISLASIGDKVYFRAKTENQDFSSSFSSYYKFVMSGKIAASGNVQSLLKADCSRTDAPVFAYAQLFKDCTSLTQAPELPASVISERCYSDMFWGCTSLTQAPLLSADQIANSCYASMFANCTSLSSAQDVLPATTLAENCYQFTFAYTALTKGPALPAQQLVTSCYDRIFQHCSSLSSVEVSLTSWNGGSNSTYNWLGSVASTGTFKCPSELGTQSNISRGSSYCPSNWTVVNTDA